MLSDYHRWPDWFRCRLLVVRLQSRLLINVWFAEVYWLAIKDVAEPETRNSMRSDLSYFLSICSIGQQEHEWVVSLH